MKYVILMLMVVMVLLGVSCGSPKQDEVMAKYDEMIQAYVDMRKACDEAQGMETYANTLKANLESTIVRYNEIYAENVQLQAERSEVFGKYQLLAAQYNNLKSNYESVMLGMAQGAGVDEEMRKHYQNLSEQYEEASKKAGQYDALLNAVKLVSRRDCPEINGMSSSERLAFYKGWTLWGNAHVADFYKPFSFVPGEFDSLWSAIEMVTDRECYELEHGLTDAELVSFFNVWEVWRRNYVDDYEGSDDFGGLLAVILQVSRREVLEINEMTADINAFYKGWGIWGNTYVQPIIP